MKVNIEFSEINWGTFCEDPFSEGIFGEWKEPESLIEWYELIVYENVDKNDFYEKDNLQKITKFLEEKLTVWKTVHTDEIDRYYLLKIKTRVFQLYYFLEDYEKMFEQQPLIDIILTVTKDNTEYPRCLFEAVCLYYFAKWKKNNLSIKEKEDLLIHLTKKWTSKESSTKLYCQKNEDRMFEEIILLSLEIFKADLWDGELILKRDFLISLSHTFLYLSDLFSNFSVIEYEKLLPYINNTSSHTSKSIEANIFLAFVHKCLLRDKQDTFMKSLVQVFKTLKKIDLKNYNDLSNSIRLLISNLYHTMIIDDPKIQDAYEEIIKTMKTYPWKKEFILSLEKTDFTECLFTAAFKTMKYATFYELYMLASDYRKEKINEKLKFEAAYCAHQSNNLELSQKLYKELLEETPDSTAVLNNLAVIYKSLKKYDEALTLLERGAAIDSTDKNIKTNLKDIEEIIKKEKEKPKKIKDFYFKRTDSLDKRIMFTIYKVLNTEDNNKETLMKMLKMPKENMFNQKMDYLITNELVIQDGQSYTLEENTLKLVEAYIDPKLERQIVKNSSNKLYRPIFFHESEINLYRVLIELFPQHLVFPNMDLKAIIDVDKVRLLLASEYVEYLFKAHVDFAIVNTTTYFPILTFEKDSDFNSTPTGAKNVEIKNLIFQTAGIPLIRLRYSTGMDYERLKEEIKQATKELMLNVHKEDPTDSLLSEMDLKRLGLYFEKVNIEEIRMYWSKLVGDLITQHTYDYILDENEMNLNIVVALEIKEILELSLENLKKKMYEEFYLLNSIQIQYAAKHV